VGRLGLTPHTALIFRDASPVACIGYLVAWWGILAIFTAIWWRQYGRPRTWILARRAALTVACCAGALLWLWIDKRVEVAVLLHVYRKHGLTLGDLLAAPPLALGAKTVYG
jgi:hypothetical protein